MTQIQLLKIIETMDDKFDNLTDDDLELYKKRGGLYAVLEESINEVLWSKDKIDEFWKTFQLTTYDGTPKENMVSYMILEKHWNNCLYKLQNRLFAKNNMIQINRLLDELDSLGKTIVGEDNVWSAYAQMIKREF